MVATILLVVMTSGFVQLGIAELAELSYVAAAVAAWTYGGRAIARLTSTPTHAALRSAPHQVGAAANLI